MTDYADLIARLRGKPPTNSTLDRYEAADALEAQARRIAHLEEMFNGWRDEARKAHARIAELEANAVFWQKDALHTLKIKNEGDARIAELKAALKPFADCGVWDGYKDEEVFKLGFKIADLRAARAAYLGEKE